MIITQQNNNKLCMCVNTRADRRQQNDDVKSVDSH